MKRLTVLSLVIACATLSALTDDILGDNSTLGPVSPSVEGRMPSVLAGPDSVGPMMLLDSALGAIPAQGVQTNIEGAWGQSAYLVAWQDNRRRLANDIYACRLGTDGRPLDTMNIIISGLNTEESYPAVGFDGTNWLVVWSDLRNGVADIYGARVAPDGSLLDSTGFIISNATYTQTIPAVDFNGTNYLVVWSDYRASTWKTYGARVTPAGTVLDPNGILLSGSGCLYPSVATNGTDWLATWHNEPAATIEAGRVGPDGTVRDPGGFIIGSGENDRFFPDAASDGANWYVVWQDRRQGTTVNHWSIYGNRITSAGAKLDSVGRPVTNDDGKYEGIPQVWFGDTAYFVTWKDDGNSMLTGARVARSGTVLDPAGIPLGGMPQWFADIDFDGTNWLVMSTGNREMGGIGGGEDPFATRVTAAGTVLDPHPNILLAFSAHWQHTPAAAWDGSHWLVVWVEQKQAGETDLRGAILDQGGLVVGEPFLVNGATGHQTTPAVAAGDSGWLVAWQDYRAGQTEKLYAARVTPAGTVLDPGGIPVATSSNANRYPAIAWDGTNWMMVFWTWVSSAYHIYAVRVTPAGTVLEPNGFEVAPVVYGTGWNWHISLGMAFDGTNYLAVWPDYRNGEYDLYGVRVTPAGTVLDPGGFTVCRTYGDQDFSDLVFGAGRYLAVWHDTRSGSDIYATLVDTSGVSSDTGGFRVSAAPGDARDPAVTFIGTNFLAAWTDSTGGDHDVYVCRISPAGSLLDPTGMPAAVTEESESYPGIAAGPTGQALLALHSHAHAPWQCTRIWAGLFSEHVGMAELPPAGPAAAISLSPNPTAGRVELRLPAPGGALELVDAAGRVARKLQLPLRPTAILDLSAEQAGVYFVRLVSGPACYRARLVIAR